MDYHDYRRAYFAGAQHIGRAVDGHQFPKLSTEQRRRLNAKNFMTDDRWQCRLLAGGNLFVEISYGWFVNAPLFGVTVFCVRDLAGDAAEWDHSLSGAFHDVPSLLARLHELDLGGRDRADVLKLAAA